MVRAASVTNYLYESMPLSSVELDSECVVSSVLDDDRLLYKKLLSMGLVQGTKVRLLAKAPLGGPIRISALGYQLSLRVSEAAHILVNNI